MLASLGKDPTDEYLEDMMSDAPGAINFTMFLTLFGERLQGTDPEDVIRNAFGCFDEENQVRKTSIHLKSIEQQFAEWPIIRNFEEIKEKCLLLYFVGSTNEFPECILLANCRNTSHFIIIFCFFDNLIIL